MRFVIQRVTSAEVAVEGEIIGKINQGFLVFIGVGQGDTKSVADKMIKKMLGLRIFRDENDKTNKSLRDVDGKLLLISQFTLYADCRKGNRPSFTNAADPITANELYEYIIEKCSQEFPVETGSFGADMKVDISNEGPFTIILDSEDLK